MTYMVGTKPTMQWIIKRKTSHFAPRSQACKGFLRADKQCACKVIDPFAEPLLSFFEMTASWLMQRRLVDNGNHQNRSHRASNSEASQCKCTSPHRRRSRVATCAPYPSHADAQQQDADASRWVPTHAQAQALTHARGMLRLAV